MGMIIWHIVGEGNATPPPLSNMYVTGRNGDGELSVGSTANVLTPTPIRMLGAAYSETPEYILFGSTHALALDTSGAVYGAGTNEFGESAIASLASRSRFAPSDNPGVALNPLQYNSADYSYSQYALNLSFSALLTDGTSLAVVGNNDIVQLGVVTTPDTYTSEFLINPSNAVRFSMSITDDVADSPFMIAAENNAGVWRYQGWGVPPTANVLGVLIRSAGLISYGDFVIHKIACGTNHLMAITRPTVDAYGLLEVGGSNEFGQLGFPPAMNDTIDVEDYWEYYDAGYFYDYGWDFLNVWTGADFSIMRGITTETDADDLEICFMAAGHNNVNQLCLGDTTDRYGFYRITALDALNVRYVFCGLDNVVVQTHDDEIYGWGGNSEGTLGLGDTTNRTAPTLIKGNSATEKWCVKGFGYNKLALEKNWAGDSNLKGWGVNGDKELAIQTPYGQAQYDVTVDEIFRPTYLDDFQVKYVCALSNVATSFIIKTDGTLWMVGWNRRSGGDNTLAGIVGSRSVWTQIGTDTDWKMISGYYNPSFSSPGIYVVAIKDSGTMWASGGYTDWELGLGWTTPEGYTQTGNVPNLTQVGTDTDWSFVSCGWVQYVALKTNGDQYISGRVTEGGNGNVMMHPENIARFVECVPDWNLPDYVGINWTYGVPMHAGAEQWSQIYADTGGHISGVTTNGAAYIIGYATGSELNQSGAWYGTMGQWDMFEIPDFTEGCKTCLASYASDDIFTFILMENGDLYQAIGQLTVGGIDNATPPLYMTRVPIVSGLFDLVETGIENIYLSDINNILFAIKQDGTAWVYPFEENPDIPPEYELDNYPYLGLGNTGVVQVNQFTQIGAGSNYTSLSIGGEHVLAITA